MNNADLVFCRQHATFCFPEVEICVKCVAETKERLLGLERAQINLRAECERLEQKLKSMRLPLEEILVATILEPGESFHIPQATRVKLTRLYNVTLKLLEGLE